MARTVGRVGRWGGHAANGPNATARATLAAAAAATRVGAVLRGPVEPGTHHAKRNGFEPLAAKELWVALGNVARGLMDLMCARACVCAWWLLRRKRGHAGARI